MSMLLRCALALSLSALCVSVANAQGDVIATLQVNKGVVMTSNGNEYVSAVSGQTLVKSERIMIAQDGTATIAYDNGCKRVLDTPGVYSVDGVCAAGGWSAPAVAAVAVAGAAAVYVIVHNADNNNNNTQNPISR